MVKKAWYAISNHMVDKKQWSEFCQNPHAKEEDNMYQSRYRKNEAGITMVSVLLTLTLFASVLNLIAVYYLETSVTVPQKEELFSLPSPHVDRYFTESEMRCFQTLDFHEYMIRPEKCGKSFARKIEMLAGTTTSER